MSDFSDSSVVVPDRLTSWDSRLGIGQAVSALGYNIPSSTLVSMTASQAIYLPILLPWKYPVKRAIWANGASAGANVDIGIYSVGGVRLASLGGVAESGTSAFQSSALSILLSPGCYYLAFVQTNANYTVGNNSSPAQANMGRILGFYQQASAYPLPATATFAAWSTGNGLPIFGFTRSASGV